MVASHAHDDPAAASDETAGESPAGPAATAATAATRQAAAASPAAPGEQQANVLRLLSQQGRRRTAGSLREIVAACHGLEDLIGLHGGMPPPGCFPIQTLTFGTRDGSTIELGPEQLEAAQQQYSMNTGGYPPLLSWVQRHVQQMHSPPSAHSVLITGSSSIGLEMVCSLFLDPGDCVVVEEFTYSHMLECMLVPRGCCVLPAAADHSGLLPDRLEALLAKRDHSGLPMPKFLYTIPTGQNPTGANTSLERKRAVYDTCKRYNLLLVEDEAYFYLQYPQGPQHPPGLSGLPRASSYLALDTQGRVIRLDSFAKWISPGLRLGWAVAAPAVVEKLTQTQLAFTLGPPGLCQAMTAQLLATWGEEGVERHLRSLQAEYAARCAVLCSAARRELTGLAEWQEPQAGMFLWLRLLGVEEASDILPALRDERLVLVPGRISHPRVDDPSFKCPYVRLSFSHQPPEQLAEGVRRLGAVLRRLQQQQQQ